MWTRRFDGTNRHAGRKFNASGSRNYFASSSDPLVAYQWKIEISGVTLAHFQEVSGLTVTTEVVKFREGGLNEYEHMLMGQTIYGNITLKHGIAATTGLFDWKEQVNRGLGSARRNGSIVLLDGVTAELARWNFTRGWPCKWTGPTLSSKSALAVETVEIAHEGLTREL